MGVEEVGRRIAETVIEGGSPLVRLRSPGIQMVAKTETMTKVCRVTIKVFRRNWQKRTN